jgi:hypothetical protein
VSVKELARMMYEADARRVRGGLIAF